VITFSYGIERPLYPTDIEPANHTHAFDIFCQPFSPGLPPPNGYPAEIWRRSGDGFGRKRNCMKSLERACSLS
jgi:hypothetical protein